MEYTINGILNVNQSNNTYIITLINSGMGTDKDKIANAFQRTIDEVLGGEPIYEFVRLNLKKDFSYQDGENIAKHMTVMLNHLLLEGYALYSLSIEDIYVINNSKYLFTNPQRCVPVTPAKRIVKSPHNTHGEFIAPELVNLQPRTGIDRAVSNWCIGALLMHLLFKTKDEAKLEVIKETSLYYFIKRCLDKNIELREVLYM